jgi:hypothetical protein
MYKNKVSNCACYLLIFAYVFRTVKLRSFTDIMPHRQYRYNSVFITYSLHGVMYSIK